MMLHDCIIDTISM